MTGHVEIRGILALSSRQNVDWVLHTKKLSRHLYVPWTSCHPPGTFRGTLIGGLLRIERRIRQDPQRIAEEQALFLQRLADRGWPHRWLKKAFADFQNRRPKIHTKGARSISCKFPFHSSFQARRVHQILRRHARVISIPVRVTHTVGKNNFLRNYNIAWRRAGRVGGSGNFFRRLL